MTLSKSTLEQFAPTGVMRVALNHGNGVLVGRDDTGDAFGISVELAKTLAAHLDVELRFVDYERAVDVSSSATADEWDVCFLAVDPERAKTIAFTTPYIRIEGCYLAGAHSQAQDAPALVASGAKVGSVEGSAYSLTLLRKPGAENVVMYPDIFAALAALDRRDVAAIAGIRQVMEGKGAKRPGSQVLFPPFMEIRQAMAMPRGRDDASTALANFLAEAAISGQVGQILEAHGVDRNCAIIPDTVL